MAGPVTVSSPPLLQLAGRRFPSGKYVAAPAAGSGQVRGAKPVEPSCPVHDNQSGVQEAVVNLGGSHPQVARA